MRTKAKVAVVGTALSGAAVAGMVGTAGPALAYDSGGLHLSAVAQSPGRLVGGRIASGTGYANVACIGAHQVISIPVVASPGRAFAPGRAVATAQIGGCLADQTCGSDSNMRTINLRR